MDVTHQCLSFMLYMSAVSDNGKFFPPQYFNTKRDKKCSVQNSVLTFWGREVSLGWEYRESTEQRAALFEDGV